MGIISDRDLDRAGRTAANLMTPNPVAIDATMEISPAATLMIYRRISALPVVKEGRLCGLLTTTDLTLTLQCALRVLQTVNIDEEHSAAEAAANDEEQAFAGWRAVLEEERPDEVCQPA